VMKINWLKLWDSLRVEIEKKNSWGKNELTSMMDNLEKIEVRTSETEPSHEN